MLVRLRRITAAAFRCKQDGESSDIEFCFGTWQDDACPGLGLCVPQDDDGDDGDQGAGGGTDFPADKSCPGPNSDAEGTPACNNGIDDDLDGLTDFGSDPGCDSGTDDGERASPNSNFICDNSLDDDLDGASDYPQVAPALKQRHEATSRSVAGPL